MKRAIAHDRMFVLAALMKSDSPCTKATWILSKHLKQHDPTAAYMLLLEFSTKWSKSRIAAKPYMDFIESARIDDGTWLITPENFIQYWKYQHNMYQTESLRYDLFLDSKLITMLDASVCSIKELHHVKIQCNSDGSTKDAYVSCLIDAASQYNSAPFTMTEVEIIQSTTKLLESVLSDMDSQTDLFDFCFGDSMAHGESQLTVRQH